MGLSLVAYRVTRSVTGPLESPGAALLVEQGKVSLSRLSRRLILAAALTEGTAMYGVGVFLLIRYLPLLATSAAVAVFAFALTYPRAHWFEPFTEQGSGQDTAAR